MGTRSPRRTHISTREVTHEIAGLAVEKRTSGIKQGGRILSDIMGRLASLGSVGPEMAMQLMGMILDGVGVGTEWSGEQLDQLGEMAQELADKVRGAKEAKK